MDTAPSLDSRELLDRVSRSFALSIRILPPGMRAPVELGYLLARAADTVADTEGLSAELRQLRLGELRKALAAGSLDQPAWLALGEAHPRSGPAGSAEAALLSGAPRLIARLGSLAEPDRRDVVEVVDTLARTMVDELRRFPPGSPLAALPDEPTLVAYTEGIAGCVGAFWTRLVARHGRRRLAPLPHGLEIAGRRYGRGLQLINILRDLPRDLRRGRCFLPQSSLAELGLTPADLLDPATLPAVRPLLTRLECRSRRGLLAGLVYSCRLPVLPFGIRIATALPARIGLMTLARLKQSPDRLNPEVTIKVSRWSTRWSLLATGISSATVRGPRRLAI